MKIMNKKARDPFDVLIFEKGLRATDLIVYPAMDLMVVVLNVGKAINLKISDYQRLKNATVGQLNKWTLIDDGIGFHWKELDEDLSLKGFIKTASFNTTLQNLSNKKNSLAFA